MAEYALDSGWTVARDGQAPHPVTLPHDAMIHERREPKGRAGWGTGFYPGGSYTYRTSIDAPEAWRDRRVSLRFEGAYHRSTVSLNGQVVGGRPSGYTEFYIDLHDHLRLGEGNDLQVVVDNAEQPNARWYSGSGLYRRVWLVVDGPTRIARDGIAFRTVSLSNPAALEVEVVVDGAADEVEVEVELQRKGAAVVASAAATSAAPMVVALELADPALWSADEPNLYDLVVRVARGDEVLDERTQRVGLRTVTASAGEGLRINGDETLLRGGCVHHDNGVLGAATFRAAEFRRVRILKDLGFNAIRSAHNPISRDLLDACDEIGVYVVDELTDVWTSKKTEHDYARDFPDWWRADLEAMVAKDRNHPSVIMYSLGNEIAETATDEGTRLGAEMAARCRALDPTRLVTAGVNLLLNALDSVGLNVFDKMVDKPPEEGSASKKSKRAEGGGMPLVGSTLINHVMNVLGEKVLAYPRLPRVDTATRGIFSTLDVAGYNYGAGQYRLHVARHPERVIVGSETNPPHIARNWQLVEELPSVIGDFMWTAWDYLGEAGIGCWTYAPERPSLMKPYPYVLSGAGVVDILGHPGSGAFLARAAWGEDEPAIVARPLDRIGRKVARSAWKSTDAIAAWSWPGYEGVETEVLVYSAAARVELLLDGRSLGCRPAGRDHGCTATWVVEYQPGQLEARAYDIAGRQLGRTVLSTAGDDVRLRLRAERTALAADGQDLAFVFAEIADDNGVVVPATGIALSAHVDGPGTLAGFGCADPVSTDTFVNGFSHTFQGRALAVLRAGVEAGPAILTVTSDGFGAQSLEISIGNMIIGG